MSSLWCSYSSLLRLSKRYPRTTSFCIWRTERTAASRHEHQLIPSSSSTFKDPSRESDDERKSRLAAAAGDDGDVKWVRQVMYNSYLQRRPTEPRSAQKGLDRVMRENERMVKTWTTLPVVVASILQQEQEQADALEASKATPREQKIQKNPPSPAHFPFKVTTPFDKKKEEDVNGNSNYNDLRRKLVSEGEKLERMGFDVESLVKVAVNGTEDEDMMKQIVYSEMGTPDPTYPPSNVPCGGCGAHLHCQDVAVPGYMPSERFKLFMGSKREEKGDLRGEICLRCYGLKEFNTALNVNVAPEEYPELLQVIKKKFALVVLMVDLVDFPCSIWPGIFDIIGEKRPVILVGNKVDLLPRDSDKYLENVRKVLISVAEESGLRRKNLFDTALISATTGYGVENLINSIYRWGMKGDVFIMGCTNVGKSSLFNQLIQSDMCKTQVLDLVQRATVSHWPGTTLNLLKFPVHRADAWRLAERNNRLTKDAKIRVYEASERNRMLRMTRDNQYATLVGHVGKTFLSRHKAEAAVNPSQLHDPYNLSLSKIPSPCEPKIGQWDPNDPALRGHWCYDTPGVVNENQILDKLTLKELMKTLPKKLIEPRTYYIKLGMSFFIGGLARIDYVKGTEPIRYTLFASENLPVTVTLTEDADEVYQKGLGTPVFGVPEGNQDRLNAFPSLLPNEFVLDGKGHNLSCADLVFSSTGWVAVTIGQNQTSVLNVWTPNGKGLYCRLPALLPFAVNLKGQRLRDTPAYGPHRIFIPTKL